MKSGKVQRTHYLSLSYNSLITNKIVHYFLFLIDICLILLQIIEVYYNHYKSIEDSDTKIISVFSLIIKEINKLKTEIKFVIYIIIIIIETISTLVLNNFNLKRNTFWAILINFTEIIFHRIGVLFIFLFLFSFKDIFLIIGIIITLPFLLSLIDCFCSNHLFFYFVSLIKYPYDFFSKVIDLHILVVKIFISISSMSNGINLSKFFFVLALLILLFLQIYLTYLLLYKSYYIMNNVSLNKIRYSVLLTNCIIIILVLIVDTKEFTNVYLLVCFANVLILSLLLIWIFYNPYDYIRFDTDENDENAFYYFFMLDRDKNKNLLLEMKIEEHKNKCGRCNLCKKYTEAKVGEKFENIDLYYIIYNNKNFVLNLMNKIVRELKKQGKNNTFSNISYFLINLIYIYCFAISQNDQCFFLNTELVYYLLNSENNQYLEEYKLYLTRIKYINNFFIKAREIIESFYKIFDEKKLEKKYEIIFKFGTLLDELKYKEIKNNSNIANYNSINTNSADKNLNCSNLLTICSIFYEELYNESISNSRIYIRDSQNLLEDLINNNIKNHKLITFEINVSNFQVKIIRAGGYLNKYENTSLFDLFPEIFKNRQIASMKKILLSSNSEGQKNIKSNKSSRSKNKDNENQYINFSFLIEEKDENNIYYKLLKIEMNLVMLKEIKTLLYLNGIYKLDKDIIITEEKKNVEFLLHFGNKEQMHLIERASKENKILIKHRHGNKYLGNKKLIQDENSLKGCKHYRVYHFLLPSKKNLYSRTNRQDINNLVNELNEDKINNSDNSDKFIFNDVASQSSSVTSSISRNNLMLYNRGNKQSQNGDDISKGFLSTKYIIWVSIFILTLAFIIEYALLKLDNSDLSQKVNFYLDLSDFSLIFNRLFCSILSLSCIGNSPDSDECVNHIDNFTLNIIKSKMNNSNEYQNLDITEDEIKDFIEKYFLDLKDILFIQEALMAQMLEQATEKLTDDLAKISDNDFLNFFEENLIHYKITQNFENNILSLSLKKENLTFTDDILLITSRCSILAKEHEDLKKSPIYILNNIGKEDSFKNLNKKSKLNSYQENFYLLLLDDGEFFVYLNTTIYKIEGILAKESASLKKNVFLIMGINAFLYAITFFFLFWYISVHLIIIFLILRGIYTFLNDKFGEITIKDIMRKKIDNLKVILSFYENDINTSINELNTIYSNYKENYNNKIKEEAKMVKKEIRNEKDNQKKRLNILKLFDFQYYKIFFTYSTKRHLYIYSLIFIISFIILLFIIYIIYWVLFFSREKYAASWLRLSRELSKSTNDLMANFLIMIYTNQSFLEVSSHLDNKDFTAHMYNKLTDLYEAGGLLEEIQGLIEISESSIKYNCKDFYEQMENAFFKLVLKNYADKNDTERFYFTLETFCESSKVLTYQNYKTAYLQLFNPVENLMQKFRKGNYSEILSFIENNNIAKVQIYFFITYVYLLELMNTNIKDVYLLLVKEINSKIDIMGVIFLIATVHLICSIYFMFSRNLEKDYQNFIQMRKIFKVCNINE